MLDLAIPALYALLVWWLGTGIVLFVARLPARTYRISLTAGAIITVAAVAVVAATADNASVSGAYLAFTAAIAIWGFVELTFLTGLILGSDRTEASPGAVGWARFSHAAAAIIHHEFALVAGGAVIMAASFAAENHVALWTYAILWLLRVSAKLNLFLGVPNLHDELLPEALSHLRSHFRRGPANPLLPVSIILTLVAAGYLTHLASSASHGPLATAGMLMASLLALAALEHVFMLIPLPVMNLWNWHRHSAAATDAPVARPTIETVPACQGPKASASIVRRGL
jgi:putative photosynthetic complex assembly protein 2